MKAAKSFGKHMDLVRQKLDHPPGNTRIPCRKNYTSPSGAILYCASFDPWENKRFYVVKAKPPEGKAASPPSGKHRASVQYVMEVLSESIRIICSRSYTALRKT